MNYSRLQSEIKKAFNPDNVVPRDVIVPLAVPALGWEEIFEAVESLMTTNLTMGEKVRKFEELFAEYLGAGNAVMFNSGSSANLVSMTIARHVISRNREAPFEVITPAVTWATTIFPICNVGAVPVLVDVTPDTYCAEPMRIKEAITNRTRAIMPVHLMGNVCKMREIMDLAGERDLMVIEDSCEAHGAKLLGKMAGTFGDMGTFSFFWSHHITTMEGGMIVTDNEELAELARAIRVFGWIRDLKEKKVIARKYPHIDERFLFLYPGYNLRPTELQGAFGIHQIKKLDSLIEIRRKNAAYWIKELSDYSDYLLLPKEEPDTRQVWFGFPITVKPGAPFSRAQLTQFLEKNGIQTRPMMAGNMAEQPAMRLLRYRKVGSLKGSRRIMRSSFFIGNHQRVGKEERNYVVNCFEKFVRAHA